MLRYSRLTLSGNILIISAYLPALVASGVYSLMWVCFFHVWFQSIQNRTSSVSQVQMDLFEAEATLSTGGKTTMYKFSITSPLERKEKVFYGAAFEMQLHHADNMEIIISS